MYIKLLLVIILTSEFVFVPTSHRHYNYTYLLSLFLEQPNIDPDFVPGNIIFSLVVLVAVIAAMTTVAIYIRAADMERTKHHRNEHWDQKTVKQSLHKHYNTCGIKGCTTVIIYISVLIHLLDIWYPDKLINPTFVLRKGYPWLTCILSTLSNYDLTLTVSKDFSSYRIYSSN